MKKSASMVFFFLVFLFVFTVPVAAGTAETVVRTDAVIVSGIEQPSLVLPQDTGEVLASYEDDYGEYDEYEDDSSSPFMFFLFTFVGPPIIALVVCLFLLSLNKTANKNRAAHHYVSDNEVIVRVSDDRFTHQTRHVRKLEKDKK